MRVTSATALVRASVTDDGKGMPGAERLGPRGDGLEGGFGMSGMRERAELVGGELEFAPAPGRGTTVRLTVPLAGRPSRLSASEGWAGILLDQAEAPHVGRDLRARGEAELLDRAGAIGLDRALGDVQLLGDLGVGVAVGDQPHHLALAL